MTLVALDPEVCPACSATLVETTWTEASLFRHGGYGATIETVQARCPRCHWTIVRSIGSTAP